MSACLGGAVRQGVLARRFDGETRDKFGPVLDAWKAIPMAEIVVSGRLPANSSHADWQSLITLRFDQPRND